MKEIFHEYPIYHCQGGSESAELQKLFYQPAEQLVKKAKRLNRDIKSRGTESIAMVMFLLPMENITA